MDNGDLDPLYKNRPTTLWVEDSATRDYLKEAWDDPPRMQLLVAGNSEAVQSQVRAARINGDAAVHGICDRDFGTTNQHKWTQSTEVFRLQMHEIENAVLMLMCCPTR